MKPGKETKIDRKISGEKFVNLLEEEPEKVVINESVLKQSKLLREMVELIELSATKGTPTIEINTRGETSKVIEEDPIDPFIRSLVGHRAEPEDRLLVHIHESEGPVPLPELSPGEIKFVEKFVENDWAEVTSDLEVELTSVGESIARGAEGFFPDL